MQSAKHIAVILMSFALLNACNFKKKSKDTETNEYYADYVTIYKNYKHVSADSTKQALESYLKKFPLEARAWSFLGAVYLASKDYKKAQSAFDKALSLDSNLANAYSAQGFLQYKANNIEKAKALYLKGISKGDSSLQTKINLLIVYSKTMSNDSCKAEIDKLNTNTINQQQLLFSIGCLYYRIHATSKSDSVFNICSATQSLTKAAKDSILLNDNTMNQFMEGLPN
jgi:tetratricopeptide (TPR) repeat protein